MHFYVKKKIRNKIYKLFWIYKYYLESLIKDKNKSNEELEYNNHKTFKELRIENGELLKKLEENKNYKKENEKLKEQITILKSFVSKYRDLAVQINSDTVKYL